MADFGFGAAVFANIALLFYVLGLLARRDTWLRINLLFGTVFYILYYYNITETPLWDAIMASLVIGAANAFSMVRLLLDRSTFGMSAENRALFQRLPTLNPGQFRRIMRTAERRTATEETVICAQGAAPDGLFYVLEGPMMLRRDGREIALDGQQFVGEISFLRGADAPASATVVLGPGAEYIVWDRDRLYRMMDRSAPLANALGALFNRDLGDKLATSWPER